MNLRNSLRLAFTAALLAWALPALGHGGEDHGAPAAAAPASGQPRAAATSEDYEVVAIAKGDNLLIYIDGFIDNAPVTGAKVTVTLGTAEHQAQVTPEGVYKLHDDALLKPGKHDLIIAIEDGARSDLLITSLEVAAPGAAIEVAATEMPSMAQLKSTLSKWVPHEISTLSWKQMGAASGALLIVFAALKLLRRRSQKTPDAAQMERTDAKTPGQAQADQNKVSKLRKVSGSSAAAALLLLFAFTPNNSEVFAHGDEDHGESKPTVVAAGDAPRRLPDASVFLPKPTQRLIEVRTIQAKQDETRPSRSFVGRIIADPNRFAVVQSTLGGRITPPKGGLPRLGQAIKAGDVLGYVAPYIAAIDRSDAAQTAGNLDQEIALAESRLDRAKRLFAVNAGTRARVEELQIEIEGMKRRRASLSNKTTEPEPLVAPISGVIASTKIVTGQVVEPKDILYQIIDPSSLWVEALAFDQSGADSFATASAVVQDGTSYALKFVGRSRELKQQSMVLNFSIDQPSQALNIGMPVTVLVQDGDAVSGIVVPKTAIVKSANGESIVWQHTEPERFIATPVKTAALDGDRVLVTGGIKPGERIVVAGAELINQVR